MAELPREAVASRPSGGASAASGLAAPHESASSLSAMSIAEIKPEITPLTANFVKDSSRSINANLLGGATAFAGAGLAGGDSFTQQTNAKHAAAGGRNGGDAAMEALQRKFGSQQLEASAVTPFLNQQASMSAAQQRLQELFQQQTQQTEQSAVATETRAAAATAVSVRPAVVPSPPFALTAHVIDLDCPLAELRQVVEGALRDANVDYEYNPQKWKAKCFVFRTRGQCNFIVRLYTPRHPTTTEGANASAGPAGAASAPAGTERFTVELQRRRGCCNMFRHSYDRLVAHFGTKRLLPLDCAAANRLRSLYASLHSPLGSRNPSVTKGSLTDAAATIPSPGGDSTSSPASMVPGSPVEAQAAAAEVRATSSGTEASFPPPPPPAGVVALLEAAKDVRALMAASAEYYGATSSDAANASPLSSTGGVSGNSGAVHAHATVDGCCDDSLSTSDFHEDEEGEVVEDRAHTASIPSTTATAGATLAPPHAAASASAASREVSVATSEDGSVIGGSAPAYRVSADEAHAVVAALGSLLEMLASDFEDVCTPASQSVSLLSGSARVRNALGSVLKEYLALHRTRSFGTSTAAVNLTGSAATATATEGKTSPSASAAPAAAGDSSRTEADGLLAINLLGQLVNRATDGKSDRAASTECRTSCAFALANFARDLYVADALMMFRTPQACVDAAIETPLSARNACLRRQLLRAMWHCISSSPRHARLAINTLDCTRRIDALASNAALKGVEPGLDALVTKISERLHHEAIHGEAATAAANANASTSPRASSID